MSKCLPLHMVREGRTHTKQQLKQTRSPTPQRPLCCCCFLLQLTYCALLRSSSLRFLNGLVLPFLHPTKLPTPAQITTPPSLGCILFSALSTPLLLISLKLSPAPLCKTISSSFIFCMKSYFSERKSLVPDEHTLFEETVSAASQ